MVYRKWVRMGVARRGVSHQLTFWGKETLKSWPGERKLKTCKINQHHARSLTRSALKDSQDLYLRRNTPFRSLARCRGRELSPKEVGQDLATAIQPSPGEARSISSVVQTARTNTMKSTCLTQVRALLSHADGKGSQSGVCGPQTCLC